MRPKDRLHRPPVPVPRRDGREAVVLREADRHVVHEEVEAARGDVVPVLLAGLPAGLLRDLRNARAERVVVEARLRVGEVRAPLPLEVRRLVGDHSRTLLRTRRVLVAAVVHRHAAIRDLHPSRQHHRQHQSDCIHFIPRFTPQLYHLPAVRTRRTCRFVAWISKAEFLWRAKAE